MIRIYGASKDSPNSSLYVTMIQMYIFRLEADKPDENGQLT